MPDPVDEGLKLIQSRPEGVLQSDLWKELGVDSRKCSRIVKKLEDSGLIERVEFKKDGIKTYLLRAKRMPVNPKDLLAGDESSKSATRLWTGCTNSQSLNTLTNNSLSFFYITDKSISFVPKSFLLTCPGVAPELFVRCFPLCSLSLFGLGSMLSGPSDIQKL